MKFYIGISAHLGLLVSLVLSCVATYITGEEPSALWSLLAFLFTIIATGFAICLRIHTELRTRATAAREFENFLFKDCLETKVLVISTTQRLEASIRQHIVALQEVVELRAEVARLKTEVKS